MVLVFENDWKVHCADWASWGACQSSYWVKESPVRRGRMRLPLKSNVAAVYIVLADMIKVTSMGQNIKLWGGDMCQVWMNQRLAPQMPIVRCGSVPSWLFKSNRSAMQEGTSQTAGLARQRCIRQEEKKSRARESLAHSSRQRYFIWQRGRLGHRVLDN